MNSRDELYAAKALARLKEAGCIVFAQYEYTGGEEMFKGLIISPKSREEGESLERIAEIITTRHGLAKKKT